MGGDPCGRLPPPIDAATLRNQQRDKRFYARLYALFRQVFKSILHNIREASSKLILGYDTNFETGLGYLHPIISHGRVIAGGRPVKVTVWGTERQARACSLGATMNLERVSDA